MKPDATVDEYIKACPKHVQELLQTMRSIIKQAVPEAHEKMAYGIPTFTFHGNLVHFAGYEHHIGFYPGSAPVKDFADDLSPYKTSKGTVQFPLDKPLPVALIHKIVLACVDRNLKKKK